MNSDEQNLIENNKRYLWLRHGDNDERVIKVTSGGDPFLPRGTALDAAIDRMIEYDHGEEERLLTASAKLVQRGLMTSNHDLTDVGRIPHQGIYLCGTHYQVSRMQKAVRTLGRHDIQVVDTSWLTEHKYKGQEISGITFDPRDVSHFTPDEIHLLFDALSRVRTQ